MSLSPSQVVDTRNPKANMFGCLPCPKCGRAYRYTVKGKTRPIDIECGDCGFTEPAVEKEA